jgi:hypothetical protein
MCINNVAFKTLHINIHCFVVAVEDDLRKYEDEEEVVINVSFKYLINFNLYY